MIPIGTRVRFSSPLVTQEGRIVKSERIGPLFAPLLHYEVELTAKDGTTYLQPVSQPSRYFRIEVLAEAGTP